jgi:hypothetical protein
MKTITNEKLISRNAKIAQYSNLGGLLVLGFGLLITIKWPDKLPYAGITLLVGFLLSQIGMYYGNRWGRNPRPDQVIDKSLKGLGREFTAYHYVTPVAHLLVSPAGIWTIMPFYMKGTVTYDKKRWRIKGGGLMEGYMRLFGQDNIGRPDIESDAEIDSVKRYFKKVLPEGTEIPPIQSLLMFVNPSVELDVESAPLPALKAKDLKEYLRAKGKEKNIGDLTLSTIQAALPQAVNED